VDSEQRRPQSTVLLPFESQISYGLNWLMCPVVVFGVSNVDPLGSVESVDYFPDLIKAGHCFGISCILLGIQ
jgi:hypothetical protein